jgi:colanic acid/amylovoran biosynthesis glycosyltransferase
VGLDIKKFSFVGRKSNLTDGIKVLTVGRLVEKKGLVYSIKAVAKVLKTYPNLQYQIVGDGTLKRQLHALIIRLGIEDKVKLLGWMNQDEVRELYEKAHIFVLPSVTARNGDQEGQGLVLQEAEAMGLPVISTLHNGIPEGVLDGQSGFLVGERDVDALANKLQYLIEHPEIWLEMGLAGRKFVEKHYDIEKLNDRLVEIYLKLLSGDLP